MMKQGIIVVIGLLLYTVAQAADAGKCIDCHRESQPAIVSEWELSRHQAKDINCITCHTGEHTTSDDPEKAGIPRPERCALCHSAKFEQFSGGKHALAWKAMNAMPTAHWQPMALMDGMKGCGGCHKIGLKSEEEIRGLRESNGYGLASCDVCHTRHQFSLKEARAPQACRTCHMGFDHPQWEMYSSSKHGVRALLKQNGTLPEETVAPTCQTCHLPGGDHAVRTAWGFLAVRLPLPEDEEWAQDQATILKALGVLDPQGNPTGRTDLVKELDLARLTEEDWAGEREKMLTTCTGCHGEKFARKQLELADDMIREADRLMAEAITIVARLYSDLVAEKPEWYAHGYPDVLTFHDAPTVIEQKLFVMYNEHRMRTFQGAFHMNPDYSFWYGWSAMKRDLTEIQALAEEMRRK